MASVVVLGHQVRHLSLFIFCEETVSLCSWIVENQVEPLRVSGDFEPLLVAGSSCRDEFDHRVGGFCFGSHDVEVWQILRLTEKISMVTPVHADTGG